VINVARLDMDFEEPPDLEKTVQKNRGILPARQRDEHTLPCWDALLKGCYDGLSSAGHGPNYTLFSKGRKIICGPTVSAYLPISERERSELSTHARPKDSRRSMKIHKWIGTVLQKPCIAANTKTLYHSTVLLP
jgi:hypothetical protein